MSGAVLTDAKRAQMNALYGRLRRETGLGRWLCKAYVAATFTGADPAEACAQAHFALPLSGLGPGGIEAARSWVKKFEAVANRVRAGEEKAA